MTTFSYDATKTTNPAMRVGIVCSRFNEFIVQALLDGAHCDGAAADALLQDGEDRRPETRFWIQSGEWHPVLLPRRIDDHCLGHGCGPVLSGYGDADL